MIAEMTAHLKDGNQYRFLDPGWSPGKTLYLNNHPEYVAPEWKAHEILMQDARSPDEIVWRTLTPHELDLLHQEHWREILNLFREWAQDGTIP